MLIEQLKRMTPEHYWLTTRRLAQEAGQRVNLAKPPNEMDRWWATRERDDEVYWLARSLVRFKPEAQLRRRKVWKDVVRATTYAALRKACGRWAQLPDVRRSGMTSFPMHILQHAAEFLALKRNRRFPRSKYSDDARIDHLARGMAGVFAGRSPMTGVERLRNMKHTSGGPLWTTRDGEYVLKPNEQYCACWRCRAKNYRAVTALAQVGYNNGLRCFIELSRTTKVPKEWISKTKRL